MKSVGEAMAIGRTFKESMQKCLRSLEVGARGFGGGGKFGGDDDSRREIINAKLGTPNSERVFYLRHAFRAGYSVERIFELTKIDPWFLHQLREIHRDGTAARAAESLATIDVTSLRRAKQFGFSDAQLAHIFESDLSRRPRPSQTGAASTRPTVSSTPAPPSSRRSRPTTTRATATRTRSCPRAARRRS